MQLFSIETNDSDLQIDDLSIRRLRVAGSGRVPDQRRQLQHNQDHCPVIHSYSLGVRCDGAD
jgi:hypothetical protein